MKGETFSYRNFYTNVTVENIYFSDNDALRIVIEENGVDFQTIP